jgi:hypothetical protein
VRRVVDVDLAAGIKMDVVNKTTATAEKKNKEQTNEKQK